MKVSIGSKIINGPWGGGNLFVKNLSNYLNDLGHEVLFDLTDPNIDLILLTDPRSRKESSSTFNHLDIAKYKKFINPRAKVVQRINECDERKDTSNINQYYLKASQCADTVVFVSSWLESIYLNLGMHENKTKVILSGSDTNIFKPYNNKNFSDKKIKIVTHHWSSHFNKGFEIYLMLDKLLEQSNWLNKLEFTYIGNVSPEYEFKNTKLIQALDGKELAEELSKNDIYLTASKNEPSGNHHIEGALCGLPILYLNSGGIPEYCSGYGVAFNGTDDFEFKLNEIIEKKEYYLHKLKKYEFNSYKMNAEYLDLFTKLTKSNNKDHYKLNYFFFYFYLFQFKLSKSTRKVSFTNLFYKIKKIMKNAQ